MNEITLHSNSDAPVRAIVRSMTLIVSHMHEHESDVDIEANLRARLC